MKHVMTNRCMPEHSTSVWIIREILTKTTPTCQFPPTRVKSNNWKKNRNRLPVMTKVETMQMRCHAWEKNLKNETQEQLCNAQMFLLMLKWNKPHGNDLRQCWIVLSNFIMYVHFISIWIGYKELYLTHCINSILDLDSFFSRASQTIRSQIKCSQ